MRSIVHIDMDCFYAAVEMVERPELRRKPIGVGGTGQRGVLCTCNYRARAFGVRSAMPVFMAREKCPEIVLLEPDFPKYERVSREIRRIFGEFTPLIEPLSLDEAYLDVTGYSEGGAGVAREIRRRIRHRLGLPSSAGIAPNKLLAKIASDWRKPNGQFEIKPEEVGAFMKELPVRRLWGVGPRAEEKLKTMGCRTCGELQHFPLTELVRHFGVFGQDLYAMCRGQDDRPVETRRERKSLSVERTLTRPVERTVELTEVTEQLYAELTQELRKKPHYLGKVVGLMVKVKFGDFTATTLSRVWAVGHPPELPPLSDFLEMMGEAFARQAKPARLLGLGVRLREADRTRDSQMELSF